ncbi:MAG: hypothetical protein IJY08_00430 [Clostridia bacterium]|nr:hypothetical protein [Clostridia bacterium]
MKNMTVVFSHNIDSTEKQGYAHGGVDPEYTEALKIGEWLGGAAVSDDTVISPREVLVGFVDRPETRRLLADIDRNQYGIARIGDKVVVCGHCVASVVMAAEYLLTLDPNDIADGSRAIMTYDRWITDIPEFDGKYIGMTDCCYDNVELVYSSDEAGYERYLDLLEREGYTKTFENNICSNRFSRWTKGEAFLSVSYSPAEALVRLISGSLEKNNFFDILDRQTGGERIADVTVTQMLLDYLGGSFGMCYIITLEDGSFVIIDGGQVKVMNGYPKTYDYVRLYYLLKELNKRPDGQIVIKAWFMTHEHADHFNVFYWFCREYGDKVTIKAYCSCSCSDTVSYNSKNPDYSTTRGRLAKACEWAGGFDLVTMQSGDDFTLGGVRFEILYTVDDLFPERLHYFNDCSFVCKMTYGGQSTMWLGDICAAPSELLCKRFTSEYLRSDIVQMAHHGLNGAHEELYDAIGAKVLFWSLWDTLAQKQLADDADISLEHIRVARKLLLVDDPPECFYHKRCNYTLSLPYSGAEGEMTKR